MVKVLTTRKRKMAVTLRNLVSVNTVKDEAYWNFDFEEMGVLDVPAEIDYIHKVKGDKKKIAAYIGHSEGTTQFFIGASMLPDYYDQNVQLFVALAPVARLTH